MSQPSTPLRRAHPFVRLEDLTPVHSSSSSMCPTPDEGEPTMFSFSASDNDHRYLRKRCAMLCEAFNTQLLTASLEERSKAWNDLVNPQMMQGEPPIEAPLVKSPFHIDYGTNVHIAPSAFINRNCYLQDSPYAPITIGEGTWLGPNVNIQSVKHETDWRHRHGVYGPSWASPVTIGEDCIVGSNAVILPGVTVGDGCVVGASSVVTRSIPAHHVAVGNPARPVRKVALDVADAPELQYERRVNRMVVIPRPYPQGDHESAEVGGMVYAEYADGKPGKIDVSVTSTAQPPSDSEPEIVGMNSDQASHVRRAEPELMQTLRSMEPRTSEMVGVDVVLFIMAVLSAWLIVHIMLY